MQHSLATKTLVLGAGNLLLASACIQLTKTNNDVAMLWLANIATFACVVRSAQSQWTKLLLASAIGIGLANVLMGAEPLVAVAFTLANLIQVVVHVGIFSRLRIATASPPTLETAMRVLVAHAIIGAGLGGVISALLLAPIVHANHTTFALGWWHSEALGALLWSIPALFSNESILSHVKDRRELASILTLTLSFVATTIFVVHFVDFPFIYLAVPLSALALRQGSMKATLVSNASVAILLLLPTLEFPYLDTFWSEHEPASIWRALVLTCAIPTYLGILHGESEERTRSLARSEARFSGALRVSSSGFALTDVNHNIVEANAMFLELLGYTKSEILGKNFEDFVRAEQESDLGKDVSSPLREPKAPASELRKGVRNLVRKDGTKLSVMLRSGALEASSSDATQYLLQVDDLSDEIRQQEELYRAQARLRAVIDAASEFSIIATDTQGIIKLFSRGAERMLGYQASELVDLQTPAPLHLEEEVVARGMELSAQCGQTIAGFEVFVHGARSGASEAREWTYVRKDQSRIKVALVVSAIWEMDGSISGFLGVAQDITSKIEAQLELERAKEGAELASRSKSEFLTNMSHEIRTPLNAVLGMTQVLGKTHLDRRQRQYLEMIRVSGQSLLELITDLLDFSKIEAGRMELANEPFDLDEILRECATIMAAHSREKDIHLYIEAEENLPTQFRGDGLRVRQIILNLASNAIKFTERGSVTVSVQHAALAGGWISLKVTVRDTGIGVAREVQSQLFKVFSQVDGSSTRRFGGTGLGLAISKRLVEAMDGCLGMKSEPGEGSEFWFEIPLALTQVSNSVRGSIWENTDLNVAICGSHPRRVEKIVQCAHKLGIETQVASLSDLAENRLASDRTRIPDVVVAAIESSEIEDIVQILEQRREVELSRRSLSRLSDAAPTPALVLVVNNFTYDAISARNDSVRADAVLLEPACARNFADVITQLIGERDIIEEPRKMELHGFHILLVEDNALNQCVARGLLELRGATLDIAENGKIAVELLARAPHAYSVVLMDMQMPVMDGFEATTILREELNVRLPIIAMSAGVGAIERSRCAECGMNDFVAKPIVLDELLAAILRHAKPVAKEDRPSVKPIADLEIAGKPAEILAQEGSAGSQSSIDPEALLVSLAGNRELRDLVLKKFVETYATTIFTLRAHLETRSHREAMRLCHTLRGTAAMLKASELAAIAQEAERVFERVETEKFEFAIRELEFVLRPELERVGRWLAQNEIAA
jgi:PAS domain S-box-containing protein